MNYAIPADADLSGLTSVVIWCDRYNVAFGTAALTLRPARSVDFRDTSSPAPGGCRWPKSMLDRIRQARSSGATADGSNSLGSTSTSQLPVLSRMTASTP